MQELFQTGLVLFGTIVIVCLAGWLVCGAIITGTIQTRLGGFSRKYDPARFYFFIGFWIFAVSLMLFASFVLITHVGQS
jgi:hypothetical protein